MLFLSTPSHQNLYVDPSDFDDRFSDIRKVIATILHLEINLTLKRHMLVHAIWEVTDLSGGFQGRYRSKGLLVLGVPIQRDHVRQKVYIVKRLLENPDQLDIVLDDVVHCVVTKEEHNRLTSYSQASKDVDGWGRYRGAGIEVIDMLTGNLLHNAEKQT